MPDPRARPNGWRPGTGMPRTNAADTTGQHAMLKGVRLAAPLLLALATLGCSTVNSVSNALFGTGGPSQGQPGYVKGFLGEVVADEPRAALAGREGLSAGGNAAGAATAVAYALSVTLPSRAGIGGGGACLAYTANRRHAASGIPEAILFVSPAAGSIGGGDRPPGVPTLARGI